MTMALSRLNIRDGRRDPEDAVFFEVLTGVARKGSSSGLHFSRIMEDIDLLSAYIHDIRLCFIALTILIYCVFIGYLIQKCIDRRRRANSAKRSQWSFQADPTNIESHNQSTQFGDLVSVRSEGQFGSFTHANPNSSGLTTLQNSSHINNKDHRNSMPSMRHGSHGTHKRNQFSLGHEAGDGSKTLEKTKLMAVPEQDTPVKHQIPHVITLDSNEKSHVLQGTRSLHHRLSPSQQICDKTRILGCGT